MRADHDRPGRFASGARAAKPVSPFAGTGATLPEDLREALALILRGLAELKNLLSSSHKSHYTVGEVARLVGRSEYTVRRWVAEGRITATRVSGTGPRGRLLVARSELPKLIGEGFAEALPAALAPE